MAREVRVAILGDSRDYHRAVTDAVRDSDRLDRSFKDVNTSADRSFRGIGDSASRMRAVVATAAAGAAYVMGNFVVSAIRSASDLQETISLTNTVFGDVAPFVQTWAQGAARGFGQSRQAALRTAGAFGNLFRQTGFTTRRAAELSVEMTELASDFASFHNADTVQVTDAMSAAFRGEYDALQRFVPTINAAAVQQEALRQTGKRHAEDLTTQEKALATYTIMVNGAGDAMGDFDRTSGGLANQQRILGAQWDDLKAKIGEKFLPVATAVVTWANEQLPTALATARRWIDDVKLGWEEFTEEILGVEDWDEFVGNVERGTMEANSAIDTFAMTANARMDEYWADVQSGWQEFQRLWDGFLTDIGEGWRILMDKLQQYLSPFLTSLDVLLDVLGEVKDAFNIREGVDQSQILPPGTGRNAGPAFPRPGEIPVPTVPRSENSYAEWMRNYSNPGGTLTPIVGKFQEGGIVPGPQGSQQLALVHAGETILPTHTDSGAGGITLVVNGEPDDFTLRRLRHAAIDAADAVRRSQAWSVT